MDEKPRSNPRSGGRTPQPPARKSSSQPSSRVSTPTGAAGAPAAAPSPTAFAIAGARSSGAARQRISANNNSKSPRAANSTHKSAVEEPATDDDDNRFSEPPKDEWLRQSEGTLAVLERQVQEAAKRTLKHQNRCEVMRDSIAGKDNRMDTLRGTYATLTRELDELECFSSGDIDSEALEEMYNSIPSDERASSSMDAE